MDVMIVRFARNLAALAFVLVTAGGAPAAELLMFTRAGCPYCIKWEREIEPIYSKTPESRMAALRKVRTDRPLPHGIRFDPPIRITPTFVLMDGDREVGRFAGYLDDATFWGLLNILLRRMDDADVPAPLKTRHETLQ